jgi:hypothetical protein
MILKIKKSKAQDWKEYLYRPKYFAVSKAIMRIKGVLDIRNT